MTLKKSLIASSIAVALTVSACSDDKEGKPQAMQPVKAEAPALLKHAPADSPYVFVSSKPFPRELTEKMLKNANQDFERGIRQYREALGSLDQKHHLETPEGQQPKVTADVDVDVDLDDDMIALIDAIFAELEGNLSAEGLESLGFNLEGRSLVYGLGMLPVMRVEIGDPQKIEAMIARIEERSGLKAETHESGSTQYRRFELEKMIGIMAVKDNYLIGALLPATSETAMLPLALGDQLPEKSMADTDTFTQLYRDYGYQGYGDGFIDTARMTAFVFGDAGPESMQVREALQIDTSDVTPACKSLVNSMTTAWPRMVVGFPEVGTSSYRMTGVMETSPTVAEWIQKLAAPVPGVGEETQALFAMGMGANLPEYREALKAGMQSIVTNGQGCEWVDEAEIKQSINTIDLMFNPMLAGIRGMYMKVNDIDIDPNTMMPRTVDAKLLLAVDDPKGIYAMMGMLNHKFTQMQIPSDGTPVQMPMDEVAPGVPPTFVAIKDKVLAFSVGDGADATLPAFMASQVVSPSPLLSVSYDVARLAARAAPFEQTVQQVASSQDDDAAQAVVESFNSLQSSGKTYGQIAVEITGSPRGLVMEQVINLK
ncbi:MAG: hypothetical protein ACWA5Q_03830 [bacterium]